MAFILFNELALSDGTNTYAATSCEYNDNCEVVKIKNTKTSGKTQFKAGYLESDFTIEFDWETTFVLPVAGVALTATGTLTTGKTFVIAGIVAKCGLKGSNNEIWKGSLQMPGTLTTQL